MKKYHIGLAFLLIMTTGCSIKSNSSITEPSTIEEENTVIESIAETTTAPSETNPTLTFSADSHLMDEYPKVDGSTATIPLSEQYAADKMGVSLEQARLYINHNKTHQAYCNLIEGKADIIFVTAPSEEELTMAKEAGITLEIVPVVQEGFVFLVNKENAVDNLTQQQIVDIYSGKITNWKEVGGDDQVIIPYQRPMNSGSQSGMLDLVMGDTEITDPPVQYILDYMSELIRGVAAYESGQNSIGYSYYYYATNMYVKDEIKLLAVDGVKPTPETIQDGSYPYTTAYYAVINQNSAENSKARKLLRWIIEDGNESAVTAGYVPVSPSAKRYNLPYSYLFTEHDFTLYDHSNRDYHSLEDDGLTLDGLDDLLSEKLNDKTLKQQIYDDIVTETAVLCSRGLPPYRGINTIVSNSDTYIESVRYHVNSNQQLLSVVVVRNLDNQEKDAYIYDASTLTFDLATGEKISIADLFIDDYDYRSSLAEYVKRCLVDGLTPEDRVDDDQYLPRYFSAYSHNTTLLEPLETISEDQKFFLWDGTVYLLLDYEIPELYLDEIKNYYIRFEFKLLPINPWYLRDSGNELVIEEKYNVYTDRYRLYSDDDKLFLKKDTSQKYLFWHSDNPEIKTYQIYGADFKISLTENIENKVLQQKFAINVKNAENTLIEFLQTHSFEYEKWIVYNYDVKRHGQFIQEHTQITAINSSRYIYNSYQLYDVKTGQQITLSDCFTPGTDYLKLLAPWVYNDMAVDSVDPEVFNNAQLYLTDDGYFGVELPPIYSDEGQQLHEGGQVSITPESIGMEHLALFR